VTSAVVSEQALLSRPFASRRLYGHGVKYLSVGDAAAQLGMSAKGLRGRISRGEMKAEGVGARRWAIGGDELERWRLIGRGSPGPKQPLPMAWQVMLALAREVSDRDARRDACTPVPAWEHLAGNLRSLRSRHPELQPDTLEWQAVLRAYTDEYLSFTRRVPSTTAPSVNPDPSARQSR
jgi:hypothetical protein